MLNEEPVDKPPLHPMSWPLLFGSLTERKLRRAFPASLPA